MIWYWVIRNAWLGIMRIASSNPNSTLRPLNCIRAKAYPAIEHRISWAPVRSAVISNDVQNCERNGILVNTSV